MSEQARMMGIKFTRKERRQFAREQGIPFEPQYNGSTPVTHKEYYGYGVGEPKPKKENKAKTLKEMVQEHLKLYK